MDMSLRREVDEIRWFHSIDLGGGLVTPGRAVTAQQLDVIRMPADLRGKTVLDVGAWDGFFSFEAERRGAERVVAADSRAWEATDGTGKRGFDLARRALRSAVEDVHVDVLDLDPERVGVFDVVLFLGVLYHMRHPLLALERVASVTGELLILETHVDMTWTRRPAAAFYPGHELRLDPTNWWGPNPEAVVGMLRTVGFRDVDIVSRDATPYRWARSLRRLPRYVGTAMRYRTRPFEHPAQGRVVVHARR
jgi:tRNA (mo5U34)-methyltransferase